MVWPLVAVAILTPSLLFSGMAQEVFALPKLNVMVTVLKNPLNVGSMQTVYVQVTSNGKGVTKAVVYATVISTVELKSFSGKTDSNGKWNFSWQIKGSSKPGTFHVIVKASKIGYVSKYGGTAFIVTQKSKIKSK